MGLGKTFLGDAFLDAISRRSLGTSKMFSMRENSKNAQLLQILQQFKSREGARLSVWSSTTTSMSSSL